MKRATTAGRLARIVLAGVLVTLVGTFGAPQVADAEDVGAPVEFSGLASLPKFPCPPGDLGCVGTFDGEATGTMAGDQFGTWTATLSEADIEATFSYQDLTCVQGTAAGDATITAGPEFVFGTWDAPGGGNLPRSVNGFFAELDFTWLRGGTNAALFLENVNVQLDIEGIGWMQVLTDGGGSATAAFAPILDAEDMPDCNPGNVPPENQPAIDAEVVGAAEISEPDPT